MTAGAVVVGVVVEQAVADASFFFLMYLLADAETGVVDVNDCELLLPKLILDRRGLVVLAVKLVEEYCFLLGELGLLLVAEAKDGKVESVTGVELSVPVPVLAVTKSKSCV